MYKKSLFTVLILNLALMFPAFASADQITGFQLGGVTMVSINSTASFLGYTATSGDHTISLNTPNITTFTANSFDCAINGNNVSLPIPVTEFTDGLYVPLRIVANGLNAQVTIDNGNIYLRNGPNSVEIKIEPYSQLMQNGLIYSIMINHSMDNQMLLAGQTFINVMKSDTNSELISVVNYFAATVYNGTTYLIFRIEPVNIGADTLFAIFKRDTDSDAWNCIHISNGGPSDIPYEPILNQSGFNSPALTKSIILNFQNDTAYFAHQYTPSYDETYFNLH